jgi:hypothetical protein
VIAGLLPNQNYTVNVYAKNDADVDSEAAWARASLTRVVPVGSPGVPQVTATPVSGGVQITWTPSTANGGSAPAYRVVRIANSDGPVSCDTAGDAVPLTGGGAMDSSAEDGVTYLYVVKADNGTFCSAGSGRTTALKAPGAARATVATDENGGGRFDVRVSAADVVTGTAARYEWSQNGQTGWQAVATDGFISSGGYGTELEVYVRGCRDASETFCGTASGRYAATPVTVRPVIVSCVPGEPLVVNLPSNGSLDFSATVEFNVSPVILDNWQSGNGNGEYTTSSRVEPTATEVRIRGTVDGKTDSGYAQVTCG